MSKAFFKLFVAAHIIPFDEKLRKTFIVGDFLEGLGCLCLYARIQQVVVDSGIGSINRVQVSMDFLALFASSATVKQNTF